MLSYSTPRDHLSTAQSHLALAESLVRCSCHLNVKPQVVLHGLARLRCWIVAREIDVLVVTTWTVHLRLESQIN